MHYNLQRNVVATTKYPYWLAWDVPKDGFLKHNTDGSYKANLNCAWAGGLFRDVHGSKVFGFTVNLGRASCILVEVWSLFYGFSIAKDQGYDKVQIEFGLLTILVLGLWPAAER